MKYKKGTFITIPNKQYLRGKPPILQVIFLWLCDHADDNGICYPSRERLADECGCEVRSIDRYMEILVADGAIKKTKRKKPKSRENASNLYQVMIIEKLIKESDLKSLPSDLYVPTPSDTNVPITQPIFNSNQVIVEPPKKVDSILKEVEIPPYKYEVELEKLGSSKWVVNKIIHNFFVKKNFQYENKKQFDSAVKRNIRPAKALDGYSASQINKTMDYCEENYKQFNWGLETVGKNIATQVNKK